MNQLPLLPILLVDEQPADPAQSRDLLWVGLDEQDRRYALKTVEPAAPLLPLTEWLCYHLCALAGIATPDFAIVTRLDGSLAFGSRWAENAREFSPARMSEVEFIQLITRTRGDIAAMFALDAFMPNPDRHAGNLLFVQFGPRMRALAFDWSRTRLFEPWPWPADCASAQVWRWLRSIGQDDGMAAHVAMSRIDVIDSDQIKAILQAAPEPWRDNLDLDAAAHWWQTHHETRTQAALQLLKMP